VAVLAKTIAQLIWRPTIWLNCWRIETWCWLYTHASLLGRPVVVEDDAAKAEAGPTRAPTTRQAATVARRRIVLPTQVSRVEGMPPYREPWEPSQERALDLDIRHGVLHCCGVRDRLAARVQAQLESARSLNRLELTAT
jgi:hypothetical protein